MKKKKKSWDCVVVHYDEIGLKGKNRGFFERLLIKNINIKLDNRIKSCVREPGQITIDINKRNDYSEIKDVLSKIPGIAYFSFAKKVKLDLNLIKKKSIDFLRDKEYETFKINTKRHDKNFKLNSMELNSILGKAVVDMYKKKVKMKNPDIVLKVEISNQFAYLSDEGIEGVGGMPTNQKQKVVCLLSGGFDSPVAAYLMMKRGCEVILTHFQNQNQMSGSVKDKIIRLGKQLSKYQIKTKIYIIPFEKIQKQIIMRVHSTTRMLIYRRFMIKISSKIAEINKADFLVVGDSLSQVASQTFENLNVTYKDSEKHIFSPLIGLDKKEIINISKKIETYDISVLPYGDCCSYFLPKHPVLKANEKLIKNIESKLDIDLLVNGVIGELKGFEL